MVLFPEEESVRDRIVAAFLGLASKISNEGVNPAEGPPVLYHYTSASGLVGILNESKIWLSRAAALNDPNELAYGRNLARDVIRTQLGTARFRNEGPPLILFYEALRDRMSSVDHRRTGWMGDDLRLEPFIACFSAEPDLLGQWAYFARDGGYSIGFQRDRLIAGKLDQPLGERPPGRDVPSPNSDTTLELCPVIYELDLQRGLFEQAAKRFEEMVVKELSAENVNHQRAGADSAAFSYLVAIEMLASRMKAPGFAPEREWRLIISIGEGPGFPDPDGIEDAKLLKFRTKGSRIIPYLEAKYEPAQAPIVSVTSGPTVEPGVALDSITRLLKAKGYPWGTIEVGASEMTLRE